MWRRLLPVVALAACAGPDVPPTEQAAHLAARRVQRAEARASDAARGVESVDVDIRHAPAPCDCPAWEAWMFGRWVRVELRPEADAGLPPIQDEEVARATLVPTGELTTAGNGWNYPVFHVREGLYIRDGRSIE